MTPCFVPQIVYSTTFGYRTDLVGDTPPKNVCAVFDLENYPGKRSLEKRPINNMEWALDVRRRRHGGHLRRAGDRGRPGASAFAKLDTIKDEVVWWSAGADTPQLLADGEDR